MDFETRLESLHRSGNAPPYETDAAVNIYERLVTAKAICDTVLGAAATAKEVVAVAAELTAEAKFLLLNDERLREGIPPGDIS